MARQSKSSGGGSSSKTGSKDLATAGGASAKDAENDTPSKTKTSIPQFISQVRQETSKVTWPTRKETTVATGMVFLMVFLAAMFFFVVDWILGGVVRLVLGLGG